VLCILPIAIIGILTLLNPDHTASLLHETRGHYVLALAAILQTLGVITIWRILDIRV
jgi:Flp pilus assembly protein TadB